LYPIGHGHSYASFAYSNFQISSRVSPRHIAYTVSVDVKNTAAVFGHEVVQLYVKLPKPTCQPQGCSKELSDFDRNRLIPGETRTVRFNVYKESTTLQRAGVDRAPGRGQGLRWPPPPM
ncbi:hypothetical protein DFJ73DRAFT_623423, partial [Zopfochytrium polystomum]